MTNDESNTNDEIRMTATARFGPSFVIRHWSLVFDSSFGIRHSDFSCMRNRHSFIQKDLV